jgi:uncharacterized protein (DUF4415 family)
VKKEEHIVRYTASEIEEMRRRGEDRTDVERLRAMTDEELEASIDWEEEGHVDWDSDPIDLASIFQPKKQVTVRLDQDVLDYFKAQGRGYQTRMNAVLRYWMNAHKS